jgi:hypothetical protein
MGLVGTTATGETADLEMVLLPLRHRGKPHARVLGALSPAAAPIWLGFNPVTALSTVSLRVIWPSGRAAAPGFGAADPHERRRRFVVHDGGRSAAGD